MAKKVTLGQVRRAQAEAKAEAPYRLAPNYKVTEDGHGPGLIPVEVYAELRKPRKLGERVRGLFGAGPLKLDGNRVYPVNELFLHHSTGPEFYNASDLTVQDWYDAIGKDRGYEGGALRSYHQHPSRNKETYAMAQFTLRRYDADGNKYGWRLTPLMNDPFNNVAWHCGVWAHNQRSVAIETCGNFLGQYLPDKALMLIADSFRAHDASLGGKLTTWAHKYVYATACPALIETQIDKLVDMQNNPDKWNAALWPAPTPPPPPPTPPAPPVFNPEVKQEFKPAKPMTAINAAQLVNIATGAKVADYPGGTEFTQIAQRVAWGGKEYYRTQYSVDKGVWNGVPTNQLADKVTPPPTPPTPPTPTGPDLPKAIKLLELVCADLKEAEAGINATVDELKKGIK